MRISLTSPVRKAAFLGGTAVALLLAWALVWQSFFEYWVTRSFTLEAYERATRIQPLNAFSFQVLGTVQTTHDFQQAVGSLRRAIELNPHSSQSWVNLAAAYEALGDSASQHQAILRALAANPTDISVQWQAANLFLLHGDVNSALPLLHQATTADPARIPAAIQAAWGALNGDVEGTLHAIPPTVEARLQMMRWLLEHQQDQAADRVWPAVLTSTGKVTSKQAFFYIESLLSRHQVDQARAAWASITQLDPDAKKRIEPGNLVENGDFEDTLLNGGFDWRYTPSSGVIASMDTSTFHGGNRSLALQYDADNLQDSGLNQFIVLDPGARYSLRAFLHAEELESANGVRLAITEFYSNKDVVLTNEMMGTFPWREVVEEFATDSVTQLVKIHIVRSPYSGRIRGKLWLDDVRIEKK